MRPRKSQENRHLEAALRDDLLFSDFRSRAVRGQETHFINELSKGGAYGLEVISFAECKNMTDIGVIALKEIQYLTKVVMLGCLTIKDDSVKELAKHLTYLEDLDLGGTSITSESLFELVGNCLNLRKVNISGCKKLNASDDTILKKHKINVESGEDIFRFHLFPLAGTELPEITKSVLKTRGSLSMNKVYIYLIKKLAAEKALEESLLDQPADHFIEILCNGCNTLLTYSLKVLTCEVN